MRRFWQRCAVTSIGCLFVITTVEARIVVSGKNKYKLEADGSVEFIQNYINNALDLKNGTDDDEFFPAMQYGVNLDYIYSGLPIEQGDVVFHGLLERKGRLGYAANLAKVDLTGTREVSRYDLMSQELLPRLKELYLSTPLPFKGFRGIFGLHKYGAVGWTQQLFGTKDPNYGMTITYSGPFQKGSLVYNLHWDKPDYNNRWRIQFKRPSMEDNESANDTRAHRAVTDLSYFWDYNAAQILLSGLWDRTASSKRLIAFYDNLDVKKEFLGNIGASYIQYLGKELTLYLEGAFNFGKIYNTGAGGKGANIDNGGYMYGIKMAYNPPSWFQPSLKFLYFSGNDTSLPSLIAGNTNNIGLNRAYMGGYSLGNENLADSINTVITGGFPMLYMAGLHGVMKGILRPGSFADPTGKENLILTQLSFNFSLAKDLTAIVDLFDMFAANPGYAKFGSSDLHQLDNHLGDEINLILGYPLLCPDVKWTLLSGYFLPGKYYNQAGRTDTDPLSFSPKVGSGTDPNGAYFTELALKWAF